MKHQTEILYLIPEVPKKYVATIEHRSFVQAYAYLLLLFSR